MKHSIDYYKGCWAGVKALRGILVRGAAKGVMSRDNIYYLEKMSKLALNRLNRHGYLTH